MAMVGKTGVGETHQARSIRNTRTQKMSTPPLGFFSHLPTEMFHMILDQLSVMDISVLSMVSKEMNRHVMDYASSQAWESKNITKMMYYSSPGKGFAIHYRHLGLLFKRCTLLLPTMDRIKFILKKFLLLMKEQHPCLMLEQYHSSDCTGFSRFGVIFQTLIHGWSELECQKVFNYLCSITNLMQKIQVLLITKPGEKCLQELQLRLFCRQVLLDPWLNQRDSQFWLVQLLKPWPMVSQAHLLLIFYGPLLPEGILNWQDLVERALPQSALQHLAKGIFMLYDQPEVKGWTASSMLTIFKELTVIPQPWHMENVSRLLVMCGTRFCYAVLASQVINGQLTAASRLITYLILVSEMDGRRMSWAGQLVQQISMLFCTVPEKLHFIQQLESMLLDVTWEAFQRAVAAQAEDRFTNNSYFSSSRFKYFGLRKRLEQGGFPYAAHPPEVQRSLPHFIARHVAGIGSPGIESDKT